MKTHNYSNKNRQASDKYYTGTENAKRCYELLKKHLKVVNYCIIGPSAGAGALLDVVTDTESYGFDLFPEREDIVRNDFLENPEVPYKVETEKVKVTLENPPFGTRGMMCKAFIDEALKHSPVVGFIVPNSFRTHCKKYNVIDYIELDSNGFTYADKEYTVNCWFVVLSTDSSKSKTDEFLKCKLKEEEEDVELSLSYTDFVNALKSFYYAN